MLPWQKHRAHAKAPFWFLPTDKGQRVQYTADVAEYDLLDASAVISIGTDFTPKCSWGFFDTAKGIAQISSSP